MDPVFEVHLKTGSQPGYNPSKMFCLSHFPVAMSSYQENLLGKQLFQARFDSINVEFQMHTV